MRAFCTFFDRNYLARGLALYNSLKESQADFRLWVLCLDADTYRVFTALDRRDMVPIPHESFAKAAPGIAATRPSRSVAEYGWSCKAPLAAQLLDTHPEIEWLTYVDADLYFFSPLAPIQDGLPGKSVWIVGHRFGPPLRHLEEFGLYQAGFIMFRNDENARATLRDWHMQCLKWCHARLEEGKYGDQKYLDRWPETYPWVGVMAGKGIDAGPWNIHNVHLHRTGGKLRVDDDPLVCFHYHGIHMLNRHILIQSPIYRMNTRHFRILYPAYFRSVSRAAREIRGVDPGFDGCFKCFPLKTIVHHLVSREVVWSLGPLVLR